jgi:hypothetical protein
MKFIQVKIDDEMMEELLNMSIESHCTVHCVTKCSL